MENERVDAFEDIMKDDAAESLTLVLVNSELCEGAGVTVRLELATAVGTGTSGEDRKDDAMESLLLDLEACEWRERVEVTEP